MSYSNVLPSIIAGDFVNIKDSVDEIIGRQCAGIHFDVMDGGFVPQITIGELFFKQVSEYYRSNTSGILDVHLMVENPENQVDRFLKLNPDVVSFHIEASKNGVSICRKIRSAGVKAGVAIKPRTGLSVLEEYLAEDIVDIVLIMSVEPGFSGQSFIPEARERIVETRKLIEKYGRKVDIHVDGGIDLELKNELEQLGATRFVMGSGFFKSALVIEE